MDELDFSALPKGKKITFEEENLFGAMTDIFGKFSDKLNFISGITIDGEITVLSSSGGTVVCKIKDGRLALDSELSTKIFVS